MRFFLDHDVPEEAARVLEADGHEIIRLREVLSVTVDDTDALAYAAMHGLFMITCNRDDFLRLAVTQPNPGLIILIRRDTRHAECGHLLHLLTRAGESGIEANINFA